MHAQTLRRVALSDLRSWSMSLMTRRTMLVLYRALRPVMCSSSVQLYLLSQHRYQTHISTRTFLNSSWLQNNSCIKFGIVNTVAADSASTQGVRVYPRVPEPSCGFVCHGMSFLDGSHLRRKHFKDCAISCNLGSKNDISVYVLELKSTGARTEAGEVELAVCQPSSLKIGSECLYTSLLDS